MEGMAPSAQSRTAPSVFERTFAVGVVVWCIVRAVPVWDGLRDAGVNPWVFIVLDLVTAVPYAIGLARVIRLAVQREFRRLPPWGAFTAGMFVAPYGYIFAVGDDIPTYVVVALLVFVALGVASVTARLTRELHRA